MSIQTLTPRKTFGALTVYERPATRGQGVKKYVVFNDRTQRALEDFRRYARAATWAKTQPEGAGARSRLNHK